VSGEGWARLNYLVDGVRDLVSGWASHQTVGIDPLLAFKIGPLNGRETQESGRQVKSQTRQLPSLRFEPGHLPRELEAPGSRERGRETKVGGEGEARTSRVSRQEWRRGLCAKANRLFPALQRSALAP
jgi:hypothetical protein